MKERIRLYENLPQCRYQITSNWCSRGKQSRLPLRRGIDKESAHSADSKLPFEESTDPESILKRSKTTGDGEVWDQRIGQLPTLSRIDTCDYIYLNATASSETIRASTVRKDILKSKSTLF